MKQYLADFAARQQDAGVAAVPDTIQKLAEDAIAYLTAKMANCELGRDIPKATGFELDFDTALMTLKFDHRDNVVVEVQVIGTYSDDGSFMWGWGHPSVPDPMQQAAWAVQNYGDRQMIDDLLSRGGDIDATRVDQYNAITAYLSNADGVYMGDHGGGGRVCACYYLDT